MPPDWRRIFPETGHRFRMALRPGDAATFWRSADPEGQVVAERCRWLADSPDLYAAFLPEAAAIAAEAVRLMAAWSGEPEADARAGLLEPDWVVLSGGENAEPRVLGGVVIFPSSWSLPEKLGRPMAEVHGPVPGLQTTLGQSIATFFARLEPGALWERDNWGLSADEALNHHPARPPTSLTRNAVLNSTWLRYERQFLARLPETGGVLFGIRVSNHRLDHVAAEPGIAARLALALETMETDAAQYKGLHEARGSLAARLRALTAADETGSAP